MRPATRRTGLLARAALLALLAACSAAVRPPEPSAPATPAVAAAPAAPAPQPAPSPTAPDVLPKPRQPVAPPATAYLLGLLPLEPTGVTLWRAAHPAWDGRGVLIAILDSGVDPGVEGLGTTSTGQPKILDLRNFSGEGDVPLERVRPDARDLIVLPGGLTLEGADAVRAVAVDTVWYGGVISELPFGDVPAADFNGNGTNRDRFGVVVVRTASGWVALIDTNGDGTLAGETPLADFLVKNQTFTFGSRRGAAGPITGAVNLSTDAAGRPRLSLFLDTAGHGTHVAGIAAGHDLYGVRGFDGVAPGAQIVALKIADDARGGLSTTGSMIHAMDYAARFAADRGLPLVMNMSFGIGNMEPGDAVMDSLVDDFLVAHPNVVFAISAGNDGPGTETMGLPASAPFALTVGATYPAAFAPVQFGTQSPETLGWWSSRGGETDKPDVVTPGLAYSTVPVWNTGEEVKGGTSMASPQAAGLVALLMSAMKAEGRQVSGAQITAALRATARHLTGESETDEGYGLPRAEAAYQWLEAGHQAARFDVRALPVPGASAGPGIGAASPNDRATAAYRRSGLLSPADTVQWFTIRRVAEGAQASAGGTYSLSSNRMWLRPVRSTVTLDAAGTATVEVRYDAAKLAQPGRYVGVIDAVAEADTGAGPAFRLVNEVIVPDTAAGAIIASSRRLAPGRAARWYVVVPAGAAGLSARLALPDTGYRASLSFYEPTGRPSRTKDHVDVGGSGGATGTLSVTANDLAPGVWEAVVDAMPGDTLPYSFTAVVPPLSFARIDSGGASPSVTVASTAPHDTTLVAGFDQVGIVTGWSAAVEHGGPYTRTFVAPEWATQAVVEVRVTPEFWNSVTDFGITLFDRDGDQLGQGPMNYDFNRVTVDLPAKRGPDYPVTVELTPAFARTVPPAVFRADIRVAFTEPAHPIVAAGSTAPASITVPAHGTDEIAIPAFPRLSTGDWRDLVRIRLAGAAGDWMAIQREFGVSRP